MALVGSFWNRRKKKKNWYDEIIFTLSNLILKNHSKLYIISRINNPKASKNSRALDFFQDSFFFRLDKRQHQRLFYKNIKKILPSSSLSSYPPSRGTYSRSPLATISIIYLFRRPDERERERDQGGKGKSNQGRANGRPTRIPFLPPEREWKVFFPLSSFILSSSFSLL